MRRYLLAILAAVSLGFTLPQPSYAKPLQATVPAGPTTQPRRLMVHYMPWYQSREFSGTWGWHWTMNHFHPDVDAPGHREAASHFRPLLGLYDSADPDVLECQVQQMKLAGIDGVIIDWYGTDKYWDYGQIHRNTQQLITVIKKAGLHFAIMYEDGTVSNLIAGKQFPASEAVAHGQSVLQWVQNHWFSDPAYLTLGSDPIFLVFGPQYYHEDQWKQIFAPLAHPPAFFTELVRRDPAVGAFDWPLPQGGSAQSFRDNTSFYERAKSWPQMIAGAWPRFQDVYGEAGTQPSYPVIEDRQGRTYSETLEMALKSKAPIIQLITWNDWGEGTMIEPSAEFGYRDLETTQRLRRHYLEPKFLASAADLRLPITLYVLRKRSRGNAMVLKQLDRVSRALLVGDAKTARVLMQKAQVMLEKAQVPLEKVQR